MKFKVFLPYAFLVLSAVGCSNAISSEDVPNEVREKILGHIGDYAKVDEIEVIKPSRIEGLYLISMASGSNLFTNASAEFFIAGDVFKFEGGFPQNLTQIERDAEQAKIAKPLLDSVDPKTLVSYKAKGETKGYVNIFTDVNCGACRQFHQRAVPAINEMGIEVRYFAYPVIGGKRSETQMTSAWCSEDPNAAIDALKSGGKIETLACDSAPIAQHLDVGRKLSVGGTPTVFLPDGRQVDLRSLQPTLSEYFDI